jgi:hypothetical protein
VKDQYVGDVKDYFKYGLLRALDANGLPLVVCWMLTAPDGSADGGRTNYLRDGRFRDVDPELHDALRVLVVAGNRRVVAIEASSLLHGRYAATIEELCLLTLPPSLVFLDPYMGFEVGSARRRPDAYVYWDDVDALLAQGHSLLVFQHWQRRPWEATLAPIADRAGTDMQAVLVGNEVAFVLLAQHDGLARRLAAFVERCPSQVQLWAP